MTRTLLSSARSALLEVRAQAPLVQCLTNAVVTGFTANTLLALGAAPAMTDLPGEAGPFARIAGGVLVNLGTPHAEQREAMLEAVDAAVESGVPWVLDPVAIGALPVRTELAHTLRERRPSIIRGNASELLALAGRSAGGRGVDTTDGVEAALPAALSLASTTGAIVAVSGPVDAITDGERIVRIGNGSPLLTRVTGGGCALGAVMAAFAAVESDRLAAAASAVLVYTVAAELAAAGSAGPGSFAAAFLDALDAVTGDDLDERAVIA